MSWKISFRSEREKAKMQSLKRTCKWVMVCCLYLGFWLGASFERHDRQFAEVVGSLLQDFLSMIPVEYRLGTFHITKWPGPFYLWPSNIGWIAAVLLAGGLFCMNEYIKLVMNQNMRPGEEHGSARFNMNYEGLRQSYVMSPAVLEIMMAKRLARARMKYKDQPKKLRKYEAQMKRLTKTIRISGGRVVCARHSFTKAEILFCMRYTQIYSKNVALSMDTKLTQLNLNTVVFGGSGAGKTRFFILPNVLQGNSSYVITDPSGEIMMKTGHYLEQQGYAIKCLNIERMEESQRYNPFAYVYEDSDIPIMVDALISNIEGPKKGSGGDNKFWDETSRTLLIAICGYLFETQPPERRNFNNVVKLIDLMDVSDDRKVAEDELDKLFNDLEQANPSSYAVSNYKVIKSAGTGKTAQNIVISTLAIFARFFKLDKIANLTYRDELHLEEIGQKKCALFIVTPQGDNTYNFLASELYTQLFRILYRQGEENARRRNTTSVAVDVPVRCLIDEAANIGTIPYLPEKVSTMRKYGISIALIYQNQAQVKALFKDDWETIVGNCDTMLFLGGIDASTVKTVSERLGKETINTRNNTVNKGNRGGGSTSTQTSGRELMTTTEIEQMRNDHCIVFIRSLKPFCDWKYPLEEHPNFKYSGDADEMNVYHPAWHLTLDRKKMASLNIKLVGEKGYQKPVAVDWATEEERESVIRDQARRRAAGSQQTPQPPAGSTMQRLTGASCTNSQQAIMTQEECERIRNMIEEKKINLGLHEGIKIFNLSLADAEHVIELKDGFAPDLEYF